MRARVGRLCRACGEWVALDQLHLHAPELRTVEHLLGFAPGDCRRLDDHDHDDPRLPEYFHAWLRGERAKAPELRSWWSARNLDDDAQAHAAARAAA